MKTVFILNGKPRAGKDSAIAAMTQILRCSNVAVEAFSSIDPVKQMVARAGIDTSGKTPEDRALWAEIGNSVEKHSQWRTQRCFSEIAQFFNFVDDNGTGNNSAVMFLHVREKLIIDRIAERVNRRLDWSVLKVIMRSNRAENVSSNAADMGVDEIEYNDEIVNNGTLDDLARACDRLLFRNGLIEQLSLLH